MRLDCEKRQVLDDFQVLMTETPARDPLFAVGDYNCRVGKRLFQNAEAPHGVLGPHGLGQRNETGRSLLQVASAIGLRLLNSFYQHNARHTASWHHSRWRTPVVCWTSQSRQSDARVVVDVQALLDVETTGDHAIVVLSLRSVLSC